RPRGAELDTARKAARIVTQEIADDFRDLLRRNLPVGARGFVSARERGGNRSRHDVADANVVVPHFLHQRLAERVQPGLRRTVGRAVRERILSREAADVDDEAAAAPAHVRQRGMACVEHAGEIRVDHFGPLFGRHRGDVGEDADARVVDQNVESAKARHGGVDGALHVRVPPHVGLQRLDRSRSRRLDRAARGRQVRRISAGDRDLHAVGDERARDREADATRSACDERHLPADRLHSHYNIAAMHEVAIIGAGELGGALAHVLARRDGVRSIRLVDEKGRAAEGKALDIAQAAPVEGFATRVSGSTDIATAAGASVIVLADRVTGGEWQTDEAVQLIRQLARAAPQAILLCAGASHRDAIDVGVGELRVPRARLFGSAPEALASGARALAALAVNGSPRDVALSVLGVPPGQTVVPWEAATLAGFALTRLLDEPTRRRLSARVAALWPPGPYALATAATLVIEAMAGRSRRLASCFVAADPSGGRKARTAALPVRLGVAGIDDVVLPPLSVVERVALENAMQI